MLRVAWERERGGERRGEEGRWEERLGGVERGEWEEGKIGEEDRGKGRGR